MNNTVRAFHQPDQNQHIEYGFGKIAPHHAGGFTARHRGCADKRRINDAGQHDDRTLQAHADIAFYKGNAHRLCVFPGKARQRQGSQRRVHINAEKAPINGEDHHERQHRDEQTAQNRDEPLGNAG